MFWIKCCFDIERIKSLGRVENITISWELLQTIYNEGGQICGVDSKLYLPYPQQICRPG
jgi:hypothetical protein